jgi:lipopolysaccharide transport protein LptA
MMAFALALLLAAPPIEVNADALTVLPGENRATFAGNVVAVREGLRITCATAEAEYEEATRRVRRLTLRGGVEVSEGERRARGEEAVYEADADTVTLTGKPRVELENGEVTAKEAVLLPGEKTAQFTGAVEVRTEDVRATAARLTAHYGEGGRVRRLDLQGNVTAARGKRTASGERAVYELSERRLTLTGAPVLREATQEVRGEKVVFTGDKVTVERPVARIQVEGGK